jgi:multiple sugar transport system substrate-binding protein
MGFGGSNQLLAFSKAAGKTLKITTMPAGGKNPALFVQPSMLFSVLSTADAAKKKECVKFVSYFVNDLEANKLLKAERGVPPSSKVRDELKKGLDATSMMVFDYISYVDKNGTQTPPPYPPRSQEVFSALKDVWSQVAFGKLTPEAAAAAFIKSANEILAKN